MLSAQDRTEKLKYQNKNTKYLTVNKHADKDKINIYRTDICTGTEMIRHQDLRMPVLDCRM